MSGGVRRNPSAWRKEAAKLRSTMSVEQIAEKLDVSACDVRNYFDKCRESTIDLRCWSGTSAFVKPHVYRVPKKIDMGPVVAAARAAVEARRCPSS